MKKIMYVLSLLTMLLFTACGGNEKQNSGEAATGKQAIKIGF